MPSLRARVFERVASAGVVVAMTCLLVAALADCRKKVGAKECEALVDRYADLWTAEHFADAGADAVKERDRERTEARGEDAFKNCPSEVQTDEFACAMKASTSAAMLKCLD